MVLLQEVTSQYIDQHWSKLSHLYPYQIHGPFLSEKEVAMGMLSRYPFMKTEDFKLAENGLVFQQCATIQVGSKIIMVYNIHLTFPRIAIERDPVFSRIPWLRYNDLIRREEVNNLIKLLEVECLPTIIAGDFNLTRHSNDYKKLTNFLSDAYHVSGRGAGFSWPARLLPSLLKLASRPLFRIDYIFFSQSFQSYSAQLLDKTGSDHIPLLGEMALENYEPY